MPMKVLNYGSINLDHVYRVKHIVTPGETLTAGSMELFCGGKGLNQSIALAKAGCEVWHGGIVGEDGGVLLDALTSAGVDVRHVRRAPGASSHTVIQVNEEGQNCIIVFSGETMRPAEADIDRMLQDLAPGDLVLMQNELYNTALMMQKAADRGLDVVFNPSPVNDALQSYPLEAVRWFLLNEVEGEALTGETQPDRILSALEARYPKAGVVLTLGSEGAWASDGGKRVFQPAFPVQAVDTTAAGDTFTGYFLAGLTSGMPLQRCMRRAALAASIAVGRKGAADSIPCAEELGEN